MNSSEQKSDQDTNQTPWDYTSGELKQGGDQNQPQQDEELDTYGDEPLATWSASEYVQHDKSVGWYLSLLGIAVFLAVLLYAITREIASGTVVLLMAGAFGFYASFKPRTLTYAISKDKIMVENQSYFFTDMKSFSVIREEGMPYIQILFQKRISIPLSVYVAPDDVDQIAELVGNFVPYDQKKRDLADRLSSRIRF